MKKRMIALSCILVMVLSFTACKSSTSTDNRADNKAQQSQKIKLRVACHQPADHPAIAALNRIKERVAKESNGRIELTLYPGNQLGDYTLVYEEVMKGSIDMAHIYIPSQYNPKLEIAAIPYLVENYDSLKKVFGEGSFFYNTYSKLHEDLGVKFLGIYADGFIGYGTKKMPAKYNDSKARKTTLIRIPSLDVYKMTTDDMGYPSTTIAYADLYSALQTNVVDGWVGGTSLMNYLSFRDAIKNFITYNVFMENSSYIINKKLWDSLSAEDKKIIGDACKDESLKSFTTVKEMDEDGLKKLKEYKINVIQVKNEEVKSYADHVRNTTWPKLEAKFGKDIMQGLLNDLK